MRPIRHLAAVAIAVLVGGGAALAQSKVAVITPYLAQPGTQFVRLDCRHTFCEGCLTAQCRIHVREGTLDALCCPDTSCKEQLSPEVGLSADSFYILNFTRLGRADASC